MQRSMKTSKQYVRFRKTEVCLKGNSADTLNKQIVALLREKGLNLVKTFFFFSCTQFWRRSKVENIPERLLLVVWLCLETFK